MKKRERERKRQKESIVTDMRTCPSMSKNLFHLDTSSFDFVCVVGVVGVCVFWFFFG